MSGFNLSNDYDNSKKIAIYVKEGINIEDIKQFSKEVFGKDNCTVEYSDRFETSVFVNVKEISDEQKTNLENKLKEKYESLSKLEGDVIEITDVPKVDIYDLIKSYIKPIAITTGLVLIILLIMGREKGMAKALFIPLGLILGISAFYVSAIAILRIPVSEYIISVGIFVYTLSLIIAAAYAKSNN